MAIEEARQARHDIRHHFVRLSTLAEQGDIEKIKEYLSAATGKISGYNLHFCENQAVDSVFGYYSTIAERENIPFHALVSLPAVLCHRRYSPHGSEGDDYGGDKLPH